MNCKWAKEINPRLSWICRSPHRADMACVSCCLDCSKPYVQNDEVKGCEGVCGAVSVSLRGYDMAECEYWEAKGDEKYESSI